MYWKWEPTNGGKARRRAPQHSDASPNPASLLTLSIAAIAAGTLVFVGHWFSGRPGRRFGGDGNRGLSGEESNNGNRDSGIENLRTRTGARMNQPTTLAELRARRLEAAEARSQSEPTGARLTPLGMILVLARKVDKLEEETTSFLGTLTGSILNPMEEKEQVRLLELLSKVQLEIDDVKGDVSVRPHRKIQTNRIQALLITLDQLKCADTSVETDCKNT